MNNDNDTLATLAKQADILVVHHAIPEGLTGVARNLHAAFGNWGNCSQGRSEATGAITPNESYSWPGTDFHDTNTKAVSRSNAVRG